MSAKQGEDASMDINMMSENSGRFIGEDGKVYNIVSLLGAGSNLLRTPFQNAILEGLAYGSQFTFLAVPDGNTVGILVTAGTKAVEIVYKTTFEGKCRFKSYQGTTFSGQGTLHTIFNRLVGSGAQPTDTVVELNPPVNTLGSQRFDELLPGGVGFLASGGDSQGVESRIEPGNSLYVEIENASGGTDDICAILDWYEEEVS